MYHDAVYAYYTLAGVSGACSVLVSATLCLYGSLRTPATRLLLLVHLTLFLEELSSLPYIYNPVESLCDTVSFLHFYSGLANAVAVGLLVISYRYHFFEEKADSVKLVFKYSVLLVLGFPLITVLPFITDSYSNNNDVWCTMQVHTKTTNIWAIAIFYFPAWSILLISTIILVYTMCQVYSIDQEIGSNMFSTTGMYSIISILAWIPRSIARFINYGGGEVDNNAFLYAYIPVYVAGILYTCVFLREKKSLLLFDRWSDWTGDAETSGELRVSFTFESNQSAAQLDGLGSPRSPGTRPRARQRPQSLDNRVKRAFYSPLLDKIVDDDGEEDCSAPRTLFFP